MTAGNDFDQDVQVELFSALLTPHRSLNHTGFLVIMAYPVLLTISLAVGLHLEWQPFWLFVGALSVAERVVTVRKAGWRGIVLALSVVPEMIYDLFQLGVYLAMWRDTLLRRATQWHHLAGTKTG